MNSLLLYLFEVSICLSILYSVYYFFFRNETLFRFNRYYLLSIVLFSFLIPLIHLNLRVEDNQKFASYFDKIGSLKSTYKYVILDDEMIFTEETSDKDFVDFSNAMSLNDDSIQKESKSKNPISASSVMAIIYTSGIFFFIIRFFILYGWLYKNISKSKQKKQNGYVLVKLNKNISPFSFLNYLVVGNEEVLTDEVIEHELVHIREKHSWDLIFIQLASAFIWFNPIIWLIHKSVKTNHEFIADQHVITKGHNLINYQELLLKQFISVPSLQLTNSFNLNNLKKRIKMMNSKSNRFNKIKPVLIIPFALFVFVLFSNLTLYNPNSSINNYSFIKSNQIKQLKGMWVNESKNDYGKYISFETMKFSVLDNLHQVKEYPYQITENKIILSLQNDEKVVLKYEFVDDKLKIMWGNAEESTFTKSEYDNSMDDYLANFDSNFKLPTLTNYRIIERTELCIDVVVTKSNYFVNKVACNYEDLEENLLKARATIHPLNLKLATVNIYTDMDVPMAMITDLKQTLRKNNLTKICYMGLPEDNKVSKLETKFVGIPRKLPPLPNDKNNAVEVLKIVPNTVSTN